MGPLSAFQTSAANFPWANTKGSMEADPSCPTTSEANSPSSRLARMCSRAARHPSEVALPPSAPAHSPAVESSYWQNRADRFRQLWRTKDRSETASPTSYQEFQSRTEPAPRRTPHWPRTESPRPQSSAPKSLDTPNALRRIACRRSPGEPILPQRKTVSSPRKKFLTLLSQLFGHQ